ncbi:MAG: hypothetical protein LBT57_02635 [Puniceicoccales bacterium]|jgi:tetratricopeptide (TPR) repeat protein|nr:hypothetical protein [Puniceicoccales bacterium]
MELCQPSMERTTSSASPFRDIPSDLLQVLTEIAHIAAGCGWQQRAEAIFDGIIAVRPESESPWIAYALAKISMGQLAEAFEMLTKRALVINPKSDLAKAFLGLILSRIGSRGLAEYFLNQVIDKNEIAEAVQIAKEILKKQDEGWGKR